MGISMGVLIFSLPGFCLLLFHGDGTLVFRKRFNIERTGQPDYARQRPIVIGTLPVLVLFPPFFGDVFLDLLHAVAAALSDGSLEIVAFSAENILFFPD